MLPENMFNEKIFKAVLSGASKNALHKRIEIAKSGEKYQAAAYTETQVFHSNHDATSMRKFLAERFGTEFSHYTAWCDEFEYSARATKKGKILSQARPASITGDTSAKFSHSLEAGFNRQKNYIIREGEDIPALVDMGVFTKNLRVAAPMWDKFRQINRFLELLADETATLPPQTPVNIIDFGCGKSYLTFAVYHYFAQIKGHPTNICGVDSNAKIVEKCNAAAKKYGYTSLTFHAGDIATQTAPPLAEWDTPGGFNIVISLHACDTATDHALANAVRWRADLICAVPCCQHELRNQFKPQTLKIFAEHGIIKERIASLVTDLIRTKLLEIHGYKAQIIEFTTLEHTQKNLLIRARVRPAAITGDKSAMFAHSLEAMDSLRTQNGGSVSDAVRSLEALLQEFSLEPTLLRLLADSQ